MKLEFFFQNALHTYVFFRMCRCNFLQIEIECKLQANVGQDVNRYNCNRSVCQVPVPAFVIFVLHAKILILVIQDILNKSKVCPKKGRRNEFYLKKRK